GFRFVSKKPQRGSPHSSLPSRPSYGGIRRPGKAFESNRAECLFASTRVGWVCGEIGSLSANTEKNHLVLPTTSRRLCRHRLQRTSRGADPLIFVCQRCSAHEGSSVSVRAAALAARISWTY